MTLLYDETTRGDYDEYLRFQQETLRQAFRTGYKLGKTLAEAKKKKYGKSKAKI